MGSGVSAALSGEAVAAVRRREWSRQPVRAEQIGTRSGGPDVFIFCGFLFRCAFAGRGASRRAIVPGAVTLARSHAAGNGLWIGNREKEYWGASANSAITVRRPSGTAAEGQSSGTRVGTRPGVGRRVTHGGVMREKGRSINISVYGYYTQYRKKKVSFAPRVDLTRAAGTAFLEADFTVDKDISHDSTSSDVARFSRHLRLRDTGSNGFSQRFDAPPGQPG